MSEKSPLPVSLTRKDEQRIVSTSMENIFAKLKMLPRTKT